MRQAPWAFLKAIRLGPEASDFYAAEFTEAGQILGAHIGELNGPCEPRPRNRHLYLPRFDTAPLIATAPKETDYGTETDGELRQECGGGLA